MSDGFIQFFKSFIRRNNTKTVESEVFLKLFNCENNQFSLFTF